MLVSTRAFSAAKATTSTRSVACGAVRVEGATGRRSTLAAGFAAATWLIAAPRPALALIPDEEDEELLEKAKANRQKRLASQKETTREFLREEGLKDKQLDSELIPVQKAVLQLAKSGSQLEAGDLKGASSTLSSGWVEEFQRATAVLDASEAQKAQAAAIFDGISGLRSAVGKGDLRGSKQGFVAVVAAVQEWASSTGLVTDLKGL